jgi:hypothetical protein
VEFNLVFTETYDDDSTAQKQANVVAEREVKDDAEATEPEAEVAETDSDEDVTEGL